MCLLVVCSRQVVACGFDDFMSPDASALVDSSNQLRVLLWGALTLAGFKTTTALGTFWEEAKKPLQDSGLVPIYACDWLNEHSLWLTPLLAGVLVLVLVSPGPTE